MAQTSERQLAMAGTALAIVGIALRRLRLKSTPTPAQVMVSDNALRLLRIQAHRAGLAAKDYPGVA
jgi:hypothetical protein